MARAMASQGNTDVRQWVACDGCVLLSKSGDTRSRLLSSGCPSVLCAQMTVRAVEGHTGHRVDRHGAVAAVGVSVVVVAVAALAAWTLRDWQQLPLVETNAWLA